MVTYPDGTSVPPEIFLELDDDDDGRLYEVMQSFLPRRLRMIYAPTLPSVDGTSQLSPAD